MFYRIDYWGAVSSSHWHSCPENVILILEKSEEEEVEPSDDSIFLQNITFIGVTDSDVCTGWGPIMAGNVYIYINTQDQQSWLVAGS